MNRNALQTFVGGYVPTSLDKKVIEKVLNETIAEMPEEKLKSFYKEVKNKGEKKMKCIVRFKLNKDIDLKKVKVAVKNFSITADGKVYKVGFKHSILKTHKDNPSKALIYEGIELDPVAYPDSVTFEKLLDNITVVNNCEITFSDDSFHVISIYYFSFESEKYWLYSGKENDYVSSHIDEEKSLFIETLYDDAMIQYNNMLSVQNLTAEALRLYENTPKDGRLFVDADTLLKDHLDSENEDENSFTFLFPEIVDVWKKATTFREMKLVEEMFQLLTGFSFKTYLRKCVAETTRNEDN